MITFHSWREVNGEKLPLQYTIGQVQLVVSIPDSHKLPKPMMERPPNAFDIVDKPTQKHLNQIASSHYVIARRAFEIWARTMRWKTGLWDIGREQSAGADTGWGTTLRDAESGRRIWTHHEPMLILLSASVSRDQWIAAGAAMASNQEPPVHEELFLDAHMHLALGEIRRAVVDAAVAAEVYIRSIVQAALPVDTGERARDLVDEANIRPVMTKVFPESLARLGKAALDKGTAAAIHQLLDDRNKVMHVAAQTRVNADKCATYLQAVRTLIGGQDPAP